MLLRNKCRIRLLYSFVRKAQNFKLQNVKKQTAPNAISSKFSFHLSGHSLRKSNYKSEVMTLRAKAVTLHNILVLVGGNKNQGETEKKKPFGTEILSTNRDFIFLESMY